MQGIIKPLNDFSIERFEGEVISDLILTIPQGLADTFILELSHLPFLCIMNFVGGDRFLGK